MSLKDTSKNTKAFEAMFTEMLKTKKWNCQPEKIYLQF